MILSDTAILAAMEDGRIVIDPFDRECLGPNSYDVHLSEHVAEYNDVDCWYLDAKENNLVGRHTIPPGGVVLYPGHLYLASTLEYTETRGLVPWLDGVSSAGRLGISIHQTAGRGDAGFCGHWTMEVSVVKPVKVYVGMPIGQLTYFTLEGEVERPYGSKASYINRDPMPHASRMWKKIK